MTSKTHYYRYLQGKKKKKKKKLFQFTWLGKMGPEFQFHLSFVIAQKRTTFLLS